MPESARKSLASVPTAAPGPLAAADRGDIFAARWPEKPLPMAPGATAAMVPPRALAAAPTAEKPAKKPEPRIALASPPPQPPRAAPVPPQPTQPQAQVEAQKSYAFAGAQPVTTTTTGSARAYLPSGSPLAGGVVSAGPDWTGMLSIDGPQPEPKAQSFQQLASRTPELEHQFATVQETVPPTGAAPMAAARTDLIPFDTAPFPYEGTVPGTDRPFLNVSENGLKGHRTWRGNVLWESQTFGDNRVLVHIPAGFDINKPAVMVVFFHGHGAKLNRDVLLRQKLPEQISLSGVNAVLVAPQFAVDAADSSPGRFWQPGAFNRFLNEAGQNLAKMYGQPMKAASFANMPVLLVAYSGGYLPAATVMKNGGIGKRLRGVVLLDALYGEMPEFVRWIKHSPKVFFVSAYGTSTQRNNLELKRILGEQDIPFSNALGPHLWNGGVAFLSATSMAHRDFVTNAWTSFPIKDVLAKLN